MDDDMAVGIDFLYLGILDSAEAHFLSVKQNNPGYNEACLYLGKIYLTKGQKLKKERKYKETGQMLSKSLEYFRRILETDSNNITALINAGMVYYELNKYNNAIIYLEKAIQQQPDNGIALQNMGNILFWLNNNSDYRDAIDYWRKSLYNMPHDPTNRAIVWKNIGIAYYNSGFIDSSLIAYDSALVLDSSSADTYVWCGRALATMGYLEKAIKKYKSAVVIDSFCVEAYGAWAEALYIMRDDNSFTFKDITKELKDRINMMLKYNPPDNAKYHLYLGHILLAEGKYKQAMIQYKTARDIDSLIRIPDIQ